MQQSDLELFNKQLVRPKIRKVITEQERKESEWAFTVMQYQGKLLSAPLPTMLKLIKYYIGKSFSRRKQLLKRQWFQIKKLFGVYRSEYREIDTLKSSLERTNEH